jgi:hypothetical protein
MAAPTGRGCSPVLAVRLPAATHAAIKAAARLQGTTPSAIARECLDGIFGQIRSDVGLCRDLNQRIAALGRGEEA